MRIPVHSSRLQLGVALFAAALVALWFVAVPDVMTPLNYTLVAGLLAATGTVVIMSYHNAQSTESLAQILHEADIAGGPATGVPGAIPSNPRKHS